MAQKWYNPFSWGEKEPSIMTKEVVDPMKKGVATPYSEYLKKEIGKGIPRYTEGPLTYDLGPEEMNAYKDFLSLDAGEWFDKRVADPEMKRFKEELLPEIREGYAGSLRGSGRFRAEEAGISEFSEYLAAERYGAMRDIPKEQFAMAATYKTFKDRDYQVKYSEWMKSLPQYNPMLSQALGFLNNAASTGTTILSALDPGQEGWFKDVLIATISATGQAMGGGGGAAAGAAAACWVAKEIFGSWEHPKTVRARAYIRYEAPQWFRDFYYKHGERIAEFISDKPVFKLVLRPLFEYFAVKGGELVWQT